MKQSKIYSWIQELCSWPNLLTISRALAALAFLQDSITWRLAAILWAGFSDGLDGWLARRLRQDNGIGAILDPIVDKFFMFFALMVLLIENKMESYQVWALFARDVMIVIFGLYLALTGHWNRWQLRAPRLGKLFTTLQLMLLFGICLEWNVPNFAYGLMIVLGALLLVELGCSLRPVKMSSNK